MKGFDDHENKVCASRRPPLAGKMGDPGRAECQEGEQIGCGFPVNNFPKPFVISTHYSLDTNAALVLSLYL